MGSTELSDALKGAEKKATAKIEADALYANQQGKSLSELGIGYNDIDSNDTDKIARQVDNLQKEAGLLGESFSIERDQNGGAKFTEDHALKDAKTSVESKRDEAQGDMTTHRADHDAIQRGS